MMNDKQQRTKLKNVGCCFCSSYIITAPCFVLQLVPLMLLLLLSTTSNPIIENKYDNNFYLYVSSFTATISYHNCKSSSKSINTIASSLLYEYNRNRIIELHRQTQLHLSLSQHLQQKEEQTKQQNQQDSYYSIAKVPPIITTPLPSHTFAGIVEKILIEKFGGVEHIHRVIQSWRLLENNYVHDVHVTNNIENSTNSNSIESTKSSTIVDEDSTKDTQITTTTTTTMMKQYCHSYVPGLQIQPFWNSTQFNWCTKLQLKYKLILKEFNTVTNDLQTLQVHGNNIWSSALSTDAVSYGIGWKTLVLMDRGIWDTMNVNLFPITSTIIHQLNIPCTEIFFASMEPYSTIKVHSDFTNFVLTCHLGLIIPSNGYNKCNITVGDTTEQWYNGQIKLLDTSLLHSAINDSNETRYILMFRIWHPDLTVIERNAIQFTYNCLNNPTLVTNYYNTNIEERTRIEHTIQQQMKFPLLSKSSTSSSSSSKSGFGIQKQKQQQQQSTKKKKK